MITLGRVWGQLVTRLWTARCAALGIPSQWLNLAITMPTPAQVRLSDVQGAHAKNSMTGPVRLPGAGTRTDLAKSSQVLVSSAWQMWDLTFERGPDQDWI